MTKPEKIAGLRVLFLPKNSRTGYFKDMLKASREQYDWRIHVVCPAGNQKVWGEATGAQGGCIAVPDFGRVDDRQNASNSDKELDTFITACERTSGVSVGRIILAGERDIGRGFSWTNFYWFHDRTARRVLADNTEPQRIVRRMFAFARDTLSETQPDLVMAGEWADPLCFVFYLAAREMGLPTIVNRKSKLWSGRCFWSAGLDMYNDAARTDALERRASSAPVSERARMHLLGFQKAPKTLEYVKENWDSLDRRGWIGNHFEIARHLAAKLRNRAGRSKSKPAFRLLADIYRRAWLNVRQAGFFRRFSEDELREIRYILIALHKDPEQAINQQAYIWANQLNTVSLLSSSLPDGCRLLVREHRNNRGRRPTAFYESMRILPGVVLIDGLDDQFKYIRNADVIVTENGSTGWEGLVLGRPVITMADTYYDGAGLAHRVVDHDQLGSALLEMLEQSSVSDAAVHDAALGHMLDAEWENSAPLDPAANSRTFELLARLYAQDSRAPQKAARVMA